MLTLYHGSPFAQKIMDGGIDLGFRRTSDPGDFGWGFYLTNSLNRAKNYGQVLQVTIDDRLYARIPNPYFLERLQILSPETPEEHLFYDLAFDPVTGEMLTVTGPQREAICKRIREVFLQHGYAGIVTDLHDQETVVFDPGSIIKIEA
jgi:hypothetical protein